MALVKKIYSSTWPPYDIFTKLFKRGKIILSEVGECQRKLNKAKKYSKIWARCQKPLPKKDTVDLKKTDKTVHPLITKQKSLWGAQNSGWLFGKQKLQKKQKTSKRLYLRITTTTEKKKITLEINQLKR